MVGFFREVCGYTEEQLKKELKSLGNLNQSEKEYNKKYTNMFGAEKICVEVYPYDKEEYGIKAYVWKEEEGYGIEIMREQGLFLAVDEYKLYEIFSGKEANINKKQEEK